MTNRPLQSLEVKLLCLPSLSCCEHFCPRDGHALYGYVQWFFFFMSKKILICPRVFCTVIIRLSITIFSFFSKTNQTHPAIVKLPLLFFEFNSMSDSPLCSAHCIRQTILSNPLCPHYIRPITHCSLPCLSLPIVSYQPLCLTRYV